MGTYPDPEGTAETLEGRVYVPSVKVLVLGMVTTEVKMYVSWLVMWTVVSPLCDGVGEP